jgi:transposase, IS30 family
MYRPWNKLGPEARRKIIRMAANGLSQREILAEVPVCRQTVLNVLRPLGGVIRREMLETSGNRLSLEERVEIRLALDKGLSLRAVAGALGRCPSTISREVRAGGGRADYRPVDAQRRSIERARRPKPTKLASNPALCARVVADLERLWSPQQIAACLKAEFGDDGAMTVSHETIYKSLYVQGRGELRKELARCLRSGRAQRRPRGRVEKRGKIPDMVMISERPAEVADRAVPGHWEGDLIVGSKSGSAIGTLVERSTRFVMLLHLADQPAETVRLAMTKQILTLPEQLRRSVTWDQGHEMSQHVHFKLETNTAVYFCDPHSPWQRGSNENTNGLLRQYFPKSTDLSVHTPADLDAAAASLNSRPRQTLGWMTPSQKFAELVASTD